MLQSTYEKYRHLIGTQINKWTVLDIVEHRNKDKGYLYAKCQCVCGTVRDVRLSKLLNNKCQDCGCGTRQRLNKTIFEKYKHLLNTTINGWTVLEIIPPNGKKHNTHALCRCRCGTVKEVNITYLSNGRSKDCGCGRKKTMSERLTNSLVGQKFGKLTVVEMLDQRNKNGRIMYKCKCECGNEVEVLGNSLSTGHTLSCGCLTSYWNMYIEQLLNSYNLNFKPEAGIYINENYYRFDFHLPDYNLYIEYDGKQHFEPVRFFGTDEDAEQVFKRTQASDQVKNRYCEENNINLLRIPYWETKNIEKIINDCLQRLNEKGAA